MNVSHTSSGLGNCTVAGACGQGTFAPTPFSSPAPHSSPFPFPFPPFSSSSSSSGSLRPSRSRFRGREAASTLATTAAGELEEMALGVVALIFVNFLGGTFFMSFKNRLPMPYTVVLFLYGILVGAVALKVSPDAAVALGEIPSELLFCIFLPVLIFEGSYAMNTNALRRVLPQSLLLATVGVILNTAFLAVPVRFLFGFSWYAAALLGSLLSATDPVAVVTLLKGLGVDKRLSALVDAEAVLNDGTAIIFYTLLLPAARLGHMPYSLLGTLRRCVQLTLLPVVLGPAFGLVQSFWLRRSPSPLHQACITVSVTYTSYYLAAHVIGTSGVLTLFFQGAFLSYTHPSLFPGREGHLIYATWEFLVHLGNTILFSLVGIILVADVLPGLHAADLFLIVVLYLLVLASRAAMLEMLLPLLNRCSSYRLTQRTVALMVHAGLRGGVSAALALGVLQEDLAEGVTILKMTCGIVLLTLLVNASTAEAAMAFLGFKVKARYRLVRMANCLQRLRQVEGETLNQLKRDSKYRNANWLSVENFIRHHAEDPYEGQGVAPEDDAGEAGRVGGNNNNNSTPGAPSNGNSHHSPEEMTRTVNRLVMSAFKNFLWRQRDEVVTSETVVATLSRIVSDLLERGELLDVKTLSFYHHSTAANNGSNAGIAANGAGGGGSSSSAFGTPRHLLHTPTAGDGGDVVIVGPDEGGDDDAARSRHGDHNNNNRRAGPAAATTVAVPMTAVTADGDSNGDGDAAAHGGPGGYGGSLIVRRRDPAGRAAEAAEEDSTAAVAALMQRLLPPWVRLAERLFGATEFFAGAHRRAQENAFMALLAISKCLHAVAEIKYQLVDNNDAEAVRVSRWLTAQIAATSADIRFFYNHFPEATNNVASARAVVSIVNHMEAAVRALHADHGIGQQVTLQLSEMCDELRHAVPSRWEADETTKESALVVRAVNASVLGRGLRSAEVRAIAAMGLVRRLSEGDVIILPPNAFLTVVSGTLRALHGPWTTIEAYELTESYGDTVGLETLLLPPSQLQRQQQRQHYRQWRALSNEATVLFISFNSIKPFLMERSLRSVKALWRAAAAEVLMPVLEGMITLSPAQARNRRDFLLELVMGGTPLIGARDCGQYDWHSHMHLLFYLSGSDEDGFFNDHTPPCFVSTFFAERLRWTDPHVVLYVVPVSVSKTGYVAASLGDSAATAAPELAAALHGAFISSDSSGTDDDGDGDGEYSTDADSVDGGGGARSTPSSGPPSRAPSMSTLSMEHSPASNSITRQQQQQPQHSGRRGHPHSSAHRRGAAAARRGMVHSSSLPALSGRAAHAINVLSHVLLGSVPPDDAFAFGDDPDYTVEGVDASAVRQGGRGGTGGDGTNGALGSMPPTSPLYVPNTAAGSGAARCWTSAAAAAATAAEQRDTTADSTDPQQQQQQQQQQMPQVMTGMGSRPHAYSSECASIFQTPSQVITPIPLLNQMMGQYAAALEVLCLAALRYVRHPHDSTNVLHAQATAARTLDFLTHFGVRLSLLRGTANAIADRHAERRARQQQQRQQQQQQQQQQQSHSGNISPSITEGLGGSSAPQQSQPALLMGATPMSVLESDPLSTSPQQQQQQLNASDGKSPRSAAAAGSNSNSGRARLDPQSKGLALDTEFMTCVCAWGRQTAVTHRHHLRHMIMGMNEYANRRFGLLTRQARMLARWEPRLTTVGCVEDLTSFFNDPAAGAISSSSPAAPPPPFTPPTPPLLTGGSSGHQFGTLPQSNRPHPSSSHHHQYQRQSCDDIDNGDAPTPAAAAAAAAHANNNNNNRRGRDDDGEGVPAPLPLRGVHGSRGNSNSNSSSRDAYEHDTSNMREDEELIVETPTSMET